MVKSHEMIWKLIDLSDANDTPYVPLSIPKVFENHLLCFLYSKAKKTRSNQKIFSGIHGPESSGLVMSWRPWIPVGMYLYMNRGTLTSI